MKFQIVKVWKHTRCWSIIYGYGLYQSGKDLSRVYMYIPWTYVNMFMFYYELKVIMKRPFMLTAGRKLSVPQGKKWPFSALRENFCSRITFNQSARRKVLFVPHSKPRIFPQTSKLPRAKPSAILRFLGKTSFLNSGTKLLFFFFDCQ